MGFEVGPDLLNLTLRRSKGFLLIEILDPNLNLVPGYESYLIETRDGRTLTGVISQESGTSVTLRRRDGEEDLILRANIAEIRPSTVSMMPEELEQDLSMQDMADLLEYLQSLSPREHP